MSECRTFSPAQQLLNQRHYAFRIRATKCPDITGATFQTGIAKGGRKCYCWQNLCGIFILCLTVAEPFLLKIIFLFKAAVYELFEDLATQWPTCEVFMGFPSSFVNRSLSPLSTDDSFKVLDFLLNFMDTGSSASHNSRHGDDLNQGHFFSVLVWEILPPSGQMNGLHRVLGTDSLKTALIEEQETVVCRPS